MKKTVGETVNTSLKTKCIVRENMRRSVTIENSLHEHIIELKGWFGMEKHWDVDYTTVLNMLAKLGADVFANSDLTDRQKQFVLETIHGNPEQQREAAADEWWTKNLKIERPEYDPELIEEGDSEEEENSSNSVKGKKKDGTHEPA